MWMLLGDPALRLPVVPVNIALDPSDPVFPRRKIAVQGSLPDRLKGAIVHVSLERPLGSKPGDWEELPDASPGNATARGKTATENHPKANNPVLAEAEANSDQTRFKCSLGVALFLGPSWWFWLMPPVRVTREIRHDDC